MVPRMPCVWIIPTIARESLMREMTANKRWETGCDGLGLSLGRNFILPWKIRSNGQSLSPSPRQNTRQDAQGCVDLASGDAQRRTETDGGVATTQEQESLVIGALDQLIAESRHR